VQEEEHNARLFGTPLNRALGEKTDRRRAKSSAGGKVAAKWRDSGTPWN
jgi:hypothetical protein